MSASGDNLLNEGCSDGPNGFEGSNTAVADDRKVHDQSRPVRGGGSLQYSLPVPTTIISPLRNQLRDVSVVLT